jgi:putative membrane protein
VRRAILNGALALRVLGLAAALVAAGCAPMQGPAVQPAVVSAAPGSEPAFLSQLAVNGLYELEVSRLAVQRATSPRVRALAQTVASHRTQSRQQLVALMRARGVAVPAQLPRDKAGKLQRLQALRPSHDFDAAYVRVVGVEDHETTIALLERARRNTRDAALASWIDRTLPVMRKDLQAAQQVAGQIAG